MSEWLSALHYAITGISTQCRAINYLKTNNYIAYYERPISNTERYYVRSTPEMQPVIEKHIGIPYGTIISFIDRGPGDWGHIKISTPIKPIALETVMPFDYNDSFYCVIGSSQLTLEFRGRDTIISPEYNTENKKDEIREFLKLNLIPIRNTYYMKIRLDHGLFNIHIEAMNAFTLA